MRSNLRYGCTHQLKLSGITSDISTRTTKPPSPASQTLRERMDRELAGTRQGLGRGILKGRKTLKQKDLESRLVRQFSKATSHMRRTDSNEGEKDTFGETGSKVSFPSELLGPLTPAQSTPHVKNRNMAIAEDREDYKNVGCEHVRVAGRVATQQGRHDDATSTAQAVGLGLSSDSAPSSQCDSGTMDTKVTEWLAQESQGHLLPAADFVERDSDSPFPSRHVALSLFPPMSPTTGNREYTPPTSPLTDSTGPFSPLNNGRDAYGNYLPSNTHDYCAAVPLPSPQSPQRVRKEQSFSGFENMSSPGRPRGASQSNFRPFWKAAATQVSNQGPAPIPLQQVDDHNDVAHDRPMVTHAGRSHSHSRASPSIRSQISAARSTPNLREPEKTLDEPSAIGTTRSKTWDSNERIETSELADIDEIVHQDFNNTATYSQRNASRAGKRCSKDSPLPSVRHKQSEDCLSNCSSEGTSSALSIISAGTADIKHIVSQGSGVSCQHNHEVQCAEAQQCHEETHEDTNRQQASQKQKHDQSTAMIHEGSAGAMRSRVPDRPLELKPRAAPEHHSPKISPNPSPYIPRYGPIPVSAQYPQKVKPGHESIGYPSVVSTSESTPSSGFKKSFQNALEKLSRKYKSSSKRHVRKGFKKREQTQIGMVADSNGWPRSRPMDARKTVPGSSRASKDDNNDESGKVESLLEEVRASESALDDYSTTESLSTNRIDTPAFSVDTMRSESANSTQTQQASYSRTGPYARSPTPEISIPVVEGASFSRPINTSDRLDATFNHAPGRLLTQFPQRPDRYGFLYMPRDEEEVHSLDPSPEYLCHWPSDDALDSDFSTETKHTPFEYDDVLGQITHEQDVNGASDEEDTMALLPPLPPDIEPDDLTTPYHAITTSAAEESVSPTMTNTSTSTSTATTATTTPPSSLCSYQSLDSTSTTHERLLPPTPAPPVPPPKDNKTLLSPITDDLQSRFSADSMRDTQREKRRRRHEDRARHLKFMRSFG